MGGMSRVTRGWRYATIRGDGGMWSMPYGEICRPDCNRRVLRF